MVCKQEIHTSTLLGTISTNTRITKQIGDMREALHQVLRGSPPPRRIVYRLTEHTQRHTGENRIPNERITECATLQPHI